MNSSPLKTALRCAGAWSILLTFVALLTIIFSFLGTLFCAAIGGMMMGATKASKKLTFAFSALCPGVLLATLRTQRTELPENQVLILAALCLAVFWMLYAMSLFLVAYEKKGVATNALASLPQLASADVEEKVSSTQRQLDTPTLHLDDLEGRWCSDSPLTKKHPVKRVLEIRSDALALSTVDPQGRICSCARGKLRILGVDEADSLPLSNGAELAAGI